MAARPSRTDDSSFWSISVSPRSFFTDSRGEVPIPSTWPRDPTCQAAPSFCSKTLNFRLEEPAFRTRT